MSYDIALMMDTGGPEPVMVTDGWNYTSNCAPMWRKAGANLAEFHGRTAGDCLPELRKAIANLQSEPAKYEAMNPENGWGAYASLVPDLERLEAEFAANPLATVSVSR
jgi:hypothetical protein